MQVECPGFPCGHTGPLTTHDSSSPALSPLTWHLGQHPGPHEQRPGLGVPSASHPRPALIPELRLSGFLSTDSILNQF